MQTFNNSYPKLNISAVALGNFDGVHAGHVRLLEKLMSFGYSSVVYTFAEHPINVISGEVKNRSINTNSEKEYILSSLGVDFAVFEDFRKIRDFSPSEFVERILIGELHAGEVVCGYNYRFGKNGQGDTDDLRELLGHFGASLTVIDEVDIDGAPVSSTRIRREIELGNMENAQKLLGRPYFVRSKVVHGHAIGRQIGYPTINHIFEKTRLIPPFGVYFARCILEDGKEYKAVVNIGIRPTVNSSDDVPTLEAHIIDFSGDLYGENIRVDLYKKSRNEIKFDGIDSLKAQISKDIALCSQFFEER